MSTVVRSFKHNYTRFSNMQYPNLNISLKNIARNLKKLRQKNKYSQLEISLYLRMERKGYQKLEYGQGKDIKLSTLLKIANYYDVSFNTLFSDPVNQ